MTAGIISDLAHSVEIGISSHLPAVMPELLNMILSPDIEIDAKTFAINAIGDLCLNTEQHFEPFVEKAMEKITNASKLSLENLTEIEDEDEKSSMLRLRKQIIETLIAMINGVMGFSEAKRNAFSDNYGATIFKFLDDLISMGDC